MTTKQFGQTVAFLLGILMVIGIGVGVVRKMTMPPATVVVSLMDEKSEGVLTGEKLFATPIIEMKDFADSKRNISFSYPKAFYAQKERDGKYAYQAYFTSDNIKNDFRQLGDEGVQLTVTVFKKGWIDGKNIQELAKQGVVNIESETSVVVDGVSATQERVLVLTDDPGCDVRTYFTKSGIAYELSLFSPGQNCETVQQFMMEYDAVVNSFRINEKLKRE